MFRRPNKLIILSVNIRGLSLEPEVLKSIGEKISCHSGIVLDMSDKEMECEAQHQASCIGRSSKWNNLKKMSKDDVTMQLLCRYPRSTYKKHNHSDKAFIIQT
jgi:hypothetical protein